MQIFGSTFYLPYLRSMQEAVFLFETCRLLSLTFNHIEQSHMSNGVDRITQRRRDCWMPLSHSPVHNLQA